LELFKAAATLISVVDKYTRLRFFYLFFNNKNFKSTYEINNENFVNIFVSTLSQTFAEIVFYRYSDSEFKSLPKDKVKAFINKYYRDKINIDDFYEKYENEASVLQKDHTNNMRCIDRMGNLTEDCKSRIKKAEASGEISISRKIWNTYAYQELKGTNYSKIFPKVETDTLLPFIIYANNFEAFADIYHKSSNFNYALQRDYAFLLCCIQKYLDPIEKDKLGKYLPNKEPSIVATPRSTGPKTPRKKGGKKSTRRTRRKRPSLPTP